MSFDSHDRTYRVTFVKSSVGVEDLGLVIQYGWGNIRNMMHTISNKEHQCASVFKENLKNIDNLEICTSRLS